MSKILDFYDVESEQIVRVWRYNHDQLEEEHTYIQWLFPLREPSLYNPDAPLLSDEDIDAFRTSDTLRNRLLLSFKVMLGFYGLKLSQQLDGSFRVDEYVDPRDEEDSFAVRAHVWLTPGNHNYLRLTRIMKSLTLLGLGAEARALLRCLYRIYVEHRDLIGAETLLYWTKACSEE